jgi:hypothetical protein
MFAAIIKVIKVRIGVELFSKIYKIKSISTSPIEKQDST